MIVAATTGWVGLVVFLVVVLVGLPTWALTPEQGFVRALGISLGVWVAGCALAGVIVGLVFWAAS